MRSQVTVTTSSTAAKNLVCHKVIVQGQSFQSLGLYKLLAPHFIVFQSEVGVGAIGLFFKTSQTTLVLNHFENHHTNPSYTSFVIMAASVYVQNSSSYNIRFKCRFHVSWNYQVRPKCV